MKGMRRVLVASAAVALLACSLPLVAGDSGKPGPSSKASPVAAKAAQRGRMAEFRITAMDGKITPDTLRVKKGDRVRLTVVSKDATYGVKIKAFGLSGKVKKGSHVTLEFVASDIGEFPLRCTKFWGFKHWSTNGKIVVR